MILTYKLLELLSGGFTDYPENQTVSLDRFGISRLRNSIEDSIDVFPQFRRCHTSMIPRKTYAVKSITYAYVARGCWKHSFSLRHVQRLLEYLPGTD